MDNYKFGNKICSLREAKNLTQRELAEILEVSDKAVSKWENGQSIPRMDTLQRLAELLGTTAEELIAVCSDNFKSITVKNDFGAVLHFHIDNQIVSLDIGEEKSVRLDADKSSYSVCVYAEPLSLDSLMELCEPPENLKEKIQYGFIKRFSKWADKQIKRQVIYTKCYYTLKGVENGQAVTVENEMFSAGDKMWICKDMLFSYPKLICGCPSELVNAECLNRTDAFLSFKKQALTSELGISIPLMLIAYPFRKRYFKKATEPKGLMKYLSRADYYVKKDAERSKSGGRHPVLKTVGIFTLFVIMWIAAETGFGILNVEAEKPVLVSADYSKIEYYREEYVRIKELPSYTVLNKKAGIEIWTDARIEGYSKTEQYFNENKVTEFIDRDGNIYLWFIPDYDEEAFNENGEYKEFEDFDEPYVYALKNGG